MLPSVRACTASAIIGLGGGAGDDAARGSSRAPASGARGSSAEGALSFCTIRIDDTERRASASSTDMRDTRRRVLADFWSLRRAQRARARAWSGRKEAEGERAFAGAALLLYIKAGLAKPLAVVV